MSIRYSVYDGPEGPLLLALDDDDHLVRLHFAHQRDHVEEGCLAPLVPLDTGESALVGPAPVAVHDDRDMPRHELCRDGGRLLAGGVWLGC